MNFNPFHIDTEALDEETVRPKRISRGVIIATLIAQGLFSLGAGEMFFVAFLVLASPSLYLSILLRMASTERAAKVVLGLCAASGIGLLVSILSDVGNFQAGLGILTYVMVCDVVLLWLTVPLLLWGDNFRVWKIKVRGKSKVREKSKARARASNPELPRK